MQELKIQALKYTLVGGLCTIFDISILYILTKYMGINYLESSVISFMSGVGLNYILCIFWIFEIRLIDNRLHEFIYYVIITLGALGINTLVIWSLTQYLGVHFIISKMFASLITLVWNFTLRKFYLHNI